jgi:putative IMPACT (imprinted ancient) family translation regulator
MMANPQEPLGGLLWPSCSGLGDVAVVITRYFGGIKLGTGGLVRAYTEAVQEVLRVLPRGEKVATVRTMLVIEYTYLERIRQFCASYGGRILEEDFGADITLTIDFRAENLPGFQREVKNVTRGAVEAIIIERYPDSIMPIADGE